MKHWYCFIIQQSCSRQFFTESYCRKKDLNAECNHLARRFNAETIRYFRRGKNHFEKYFLDFEVIEWPLFLCRRAPDRCAPFLCKVLHFTPFLPQSLCKLTKRNFPFSLDIHRLLWYNTIVVKGRGVLPNRKGRCKLKKFFKNFWKTPWRTAQSVI